MSQMDPISNVKGIIQGHIFAGIKLARALPDVVAGVAAMQALAASLAASCVKTLGLAPELDAHQDLAAALGLAPGPDCRERLIGMLADIGRGRERQAEVVGEHGAELPGAASKCLPRRGGE